jgi:hypothetical protein
MTETIIKRKIIKRKKRAKKVKPTQEQKQTQIINIYNPTKLRSNPLSIRRQKEKDRISPLQNSRVYRPIAINQHVNSFEVEQRLYSKLADENRLNMLSQQREQARMERERTAREQQMKTENENYQRAVFDFIKRKESGIDERIRNQIDERLNVSFESVPSKGYGDEPLDKPAQTPPEPIDLTEEKEPLSGSTTQVAKPIIDVVATPPAGTRPPTPPPEEGQAGIQTAQTVPITIVDKFNSLTNEQKDTIREMIQKKYPNTLLFTKKGKISSQTTINKQVRVTVKNDFNLIYNKLTSGQTIKKRGRPRKDIVV